MNMAKHVARAWRSRLGILATIAIVGLLLAACGSATSSAPVASGTSGAGTTIRITTRKNFFDKTRLEARAGTITIVSDNKDNGIPHNIHFFRGTDANGESVGTTPMKSGPDTQALTMTLQPGTYFYQCDMHPSANGILTVTA